MTAAFRKIYLIAGEASGDLLGAHLMRSLKAQSDIPIKFFGVGGEKMAAEGLESLFPYYELSMMGFIEILPYAFNLAVRINSTVDDIRAKAPEAVITIDSPGFCFRVVKKLRQHKLASTFVHYVAPTVWAYKPERAQKCAALFDHMLLLLPFEPPYFEAVGLPCTWVGHAAVAETPIGDGKAFRDKYEIADATRVLCLMPGSRKGEVERHMPIFAKTVAMLAAQFPDIAMAVAVPQNVMPFVAPYFKGCPFRAVVMAGEQDKKNAIAASNFAIVKSGTVALEVALAGTPMLVTYKVNALSAWAFRRMSTLKYVSLINIILDKPVIPEFLQELCSPLLLAGAAAYYLQNESARNHQKEQAKLALSTLIPPNGALPSDLAARTVLQLLPR